MPFQKGNKLGKGRPKAPHTIATEIYRKYLVDEVVKHREGLIKAMIDKGLTGDIPAIKEAHERVLGKVTENIVVEDKRILLDYDN